MYVFRQHRRSTIFESLIPEGLLREWVRVFDRVYAESADACEDLAPEDVHHFRPQIRLLKANMAFDTAVRRYGLEIVTVRRPNGDSHRLLQVRDDAQNSLVLAIHAHLSSPYALIRYAKYRHRYASFRYVEQSQYPLFKDMFDYEPILLKEDPPPAVCVLGHGTLKKTGEGQLGFLNVHFLSPNGTLYVGSSIDLLFRYPEELGSARVEKIADAIGTFPPAATRVYEQTAE